MSGEKTPREPALEAEIDLFLALSMAPELLGATNGVLHEPSTDSLLQTYVVGRRVIGAMLMVCSERVNCLSAYYIRMSNDEPWSVLAEYRGSTEDDRRYRPTSLQSAVDQVAIHRINQHPISWPFDKVRPADLFPERKTTPLHKATHFIKDRLRLSSS